MYIIIGTAAGVLLLLFLLTLIPYLMAFYSNRKKQIPLYYGLEGKDDAQTLRCRELIDNFIKLPYEDVYIQSYDGLRLHGRYYHTSDNAPIDILFHGYKSIVDRDFSGIGIECLRRGHNALMIDERAHGKSDGKTISFGIKERFDVISWCEYANERFGNNIKIVLLGISMGAATVLMASELNLPENVIGIVADCPYSSPEEIIKKVTRDLHLPVWLLYPFTRLAARVFGGFGLESASALEAVKNTDIPIMLIHGEADDFVPTRMSDRIAEQGGTISYTRVKDARHGLSFIADYELYMNKFNEFLDKVENNEDQ